MWDDLVDFGETILPAYRRNVWADQACYIEVWLEKDALSGIFEDVLRPYGVTLNVGRGYDGWDSIHNASERFGNCDDEVILYFGDFDPSGEDMVRSLRERLGFFGCEQEIVKCALTLDDVRSHNLPPDFTKATDTRQKGFVEKYGDIAVELDALPVDVLVQRITNEIKSRMDLNALAETKRVEKTERVKLAVAIRGF
jgi:hypothetical protein